MYNCNNLLILQLSVVIAFLSAFQISIFEWAEQFYYG